MAGLVERIRLHALRTAAQVAIRGDEDAISFQDLEASSNWLAREFLAVGCAGTVAHFGPCGASQAVALLAAQKSGLAFTALHDATPAPMLMDRIEAAGVEIVTADKGRLEQAASLGPHAIEVQTDKGSEPVEFDAPPRAISHIRFTSGSTGRSRGVCLSHAHTERMTNVIERFLPVDGGNQFALLGQFWPMVMLYAMSVGATLNCIDFGRIGLSETRGRLRRAKVSALFAYPQAIRAVLRNGGHFPDLRYLHASGDALSNSDLRQFETSFSHGALVHSSFGSTEFPWIAAQMFEVGKSQIQGPFPIGKPVFPDEVRLLREDGTPCAVGETGQIVVNSLDLPLGYLNDPTRTCEHFDLDEKSRVFRTGDMAYADEHGIWHGRGRIDDMINVRGANVWPSEVEHALKTHPAVRDAAVTKANTATGELSLTAFFTADQDLEARELRGYLSTRLPGTMVPSAFQQLPDLPKTETGKIIRSKLPQITVGPGTAADPQSPEGESEHLIAAVWQAMLGRSELDRNSDFLDLGGDSLMAVEMLARVESVFGRRIPIDVLSLEGGSISALARWLDTTSPDNTPIQMRGGNGQTLVVFPVAGGHLSDYLRLVEVFQGPHQILGLRPNGLSNQSEPEADMAILAGNMVRSIQPRDARPDLLGYSFGALTAYEAACQLAIEGRPVGRLILIDPPLDWKSATPALRFLYRCLRAGDYPRFRGGLRHLARIVPDNRRLDAAHLQAALKFHPKPLAGVRTLIIESTDTTSQRHGHDTWADLISGDLEVRQVAASHRALMSLPTVEQIAGMVATWLKRDP